ncbi:hypothetical protein M513_14009 [Trichuris suis]|uniref:Uncharacterized protein n=1 Tax=Trichuris suis TaxID=68888 RepID=A0A085LJG7_9BILA|nr:hypothetical protein M513_14009 [Trichuris suis]
MMLVHLSYNYTTHEYRRATGNHSLSTFPVYRSYNTHMDGYNRMIGGRKAGMHVTVNRKYDFCTYRCQSMRGKHNGQLLFTRGRYDSCMYQYRSIRRNYTDRLLIRHRSYVYLTHCAEQIREIKVKQTMHFFLQFSHNSLCPFPLITAHPYVGRASQFQKQSNF